MSLLVTLVILGIITGIAVPSVIGHIKRAQENVCNSNRQQVARMYRTQLQIERMDHSETRFRQFITNYGDDLCPIGGEYRYENEEVLCSEHSNNEITEEDVPFF